MAIAELALRLRRSDDDLVAKSPMKSREFHPDVTSIAQCSHKDVRPLPDNQNDPYLNRSRKLFVAGYALQCWSCRVMHLT